MFMTIVLLNAKNLSEFGHWLRTFQVNSIKLVKLGLTIFTSYAKLNPVFCGKCTKTVKKELRQK